jgi:hypothetical protein
MISKTIPKYHAARENAERSNKIENRRTHWWQERHLVIERPLFFRQGIENSVGEIRCNKRRVTSNNRISSPV